MNTDKLKELALAATALNLDTAETMKDRFDDQTWECPLCDGEGYIDGGLDFCNIDYVALGVQFYGIGKDHQTAEAYFRAANPSTILALIAQRDELLTAVELAESFIADLRVPQNTYEASIQLRNGLEALSFIRAAIAKAVQP